jgi:hypothetical protein
LPLTLRDHDQVRKFEGLLTDGNEDELLTSEWNTDIWEHLRQQGRPSDMELYDRRLYISYTRDGLSHHKLCKDNILRVRAHFLDDVIECFTSIKYMDTSLTPDGMIFRLAWKFDALG